MFLTSNQVFYLWRCKGCFKINIQIMYHNNQTRRKDNILNKPPHVVLYCIVSGVYYGHNLNWCMNEMMSSLHVRVSGSRCLASTTSSIPFSVVI